MVAQKVICLAAIWRVSYFLIPHYITQKIRIIRWENRQIIADEILCDRIIG